jgi:hypothetical protein
LPITTTYPRWAQEDPVRFFSAAEQHESARWTAYEEWKVSVPRELNRRQQMDAARDFLRASFGTQHPYVFAIHDPLAADGGRQPHIHVIFSARMVDAYDRTPEQFFRRHNRAHPERGGAEKDRAFSYMGAVKAFRTLYTDTMNLALERGGYAARLHPDSLESRGIDRTPEPRLHPSDSNALKYQYRVTPVMQHVFDHRCQRTQHAESELAQAQEYWAQRKHALGITRELSYDQRLERIVHAREHAIHYALERVSLAQLVEQEQTLMRSVRELEQYVERVQHYHQQEVHFEPRQGREGWQRMLDAERVLVWICSHDSGHIWEEIFPHPLGEHICHL